MNTPPMKSVFFKLMTAYLVAFFLIAGGAGLVRFFSATSLNMHISSRNLHYYAETLTDRIGIPPAPAEAQKIAGETGLRISIEGPGILWSSAGDLVDNESGIFHRDDMWSFFSGVDEPYIEITKSGYNFYFRDFHADHHMSFIIWLIMTGSIVAALVTSYLMVRHQLKPLHEMYEIALDFGVSDWKKRVRPKGSDELATLAGAMNSMADRIEEYIHSMHDLLAAVSHELRSPLTRMKVALEFIDDKNARESLNEEIDTLDRLTGNLLEQRRLATQQGTLNYEEVDLHSWVEEVCRPYFIKDCPLSVSHSGSDRKLLLDRSRMDMALRNLIENSLCHAHGTPIRISMDTTGPQGFILGVSDGGPGIPDELIKRLGEPFLLGDTSRGGTRSGGGFGLGLSIVKAVAEAHGAVFYAENLHSGGLLVELRYP